MARRVLFGSPTDSTNRTLVDVLRTERAGGIMLLLGAVVAILWANSRWSESYDSLSSFTIGPEALHLNLSLSTWAQDGLLAIFFFVIGLELKRELLESHSRVRLELQPKNLAPTLERLATEGFSRYATAGDELVWKPIG